MPLRKKVLKVRIIGGKNRGRKLLEPRGFRIRPTADRVREAIFNILSSYFQNGIHDRMVADLFSGTGALAIEALSRGAKSAVLVDNQTEAINIIKKNIQTCGEENNTFLLKRDATYLGSLPNNFVGANIVFLDPPYGRNLVPSALRSLVENEWLAMDALCVIEVSNNENFNCLVEFEEVDERKYGRHTIKFLKFSR